MVRGADDAMRPGMPDDIGAEHALLLRFRRERDEAVAQRDALARLGAPPMLGRSVRAPSF